MSDEGFHEIQLNSKQLIFLCMQMLQLMHFDFSGKMRNRVKRA